MKIKKGDTVSILSGNDRGKQGHVLQVFPHIGKVVVEGIQIRKRHTKPRQSGKKGEIIALPAAIQVSRVAFVCASCKKSVRLGLKIENKEKIRVCKKCGKSV